MNIAIYHNLPTGGAKRTLWYFMKLLQQQGHTLDLYTLENLEPDFFELHNFTRKTFIHPYQFQAYRYIGSPFLSNGINLFRQQKNFRRLDQISQRIAAQINQGQYDLAFVHPCRYVQAPALLKYLDLPGVYFCQEPPRSYYEPAVTYPGIQGAMKSPPRVRVPALLKKLSGLLYTFRLHKCKQYDLLNTRHATLVLVNSCYSKEAVYRIYEIFPRVNYLGVDARHFVPLPEIEKQPCVLSVGHLNPLKQHHFVIDSVALIPEKRRPAVVVIANGSYQAYKLYLSRLAEQRGVRLTILELISDEELVKWYNRAMMVVYPPILEPLGLVALEAMACSTPVIGVREGGVRETIIAGETGFLLERNEHDFSRAIDMLLQDSSLRTRLGTAGRQHVLSHWTWEQSVEHVIGYFRSLC